jgi:hypothetical protein
MKGPTWPILIFVFLIISWNPLSYAEYRVYQYLIMQTLKTPLDTRPYLVTSTLHPNAYLAYYGGPDSIKLNLLRTWVCKGFTGDKIILCPSPLELISIGGVPYENRK